MFDLTVSETGETGSTTLDLPGAPMPFAVHVFGAENVKRWNDASDASRGHTAKGIVLDLATIAALTGETDAQVVVLYNQTLAAEGIEDHAVEYIGE
jgi:hypothetical protein